MRIHLFLCSLVFTLTIQAHEFWLEPSSYTPHVNSIVKIRLWIGHHFVGEPYARNPFHIKEFVMVDKGSPQWVVGQTGKDPAGLVRVKKPGLAILGYRSRRNFSQLEAEKFHAYLREEGLEKVIDLRKKRGESEKSGREFYSRCAKSLLAVDKSPSGKYDRVFGYPLELVPGKNPYEFNTKEKFPIRLLYRGKPLSGVLITAVQHKGKPLYQTSDSQGWVHFALTSPGAWLIEAMHIVRLSEDLDADWESFWSSLTFEVPQN